MELIPIAIVFVGFIICLVSLKFWIRKCREIGLVWEDMNKHKSPKNVAASGGLIVVFSFLLIVLFYVAFRTMFRDVDKVTINLLSILIVVLIAGFVGFVDDMLGWKTRGLSSRVRIFLVLLSAIPLMVINAGDSLMNVPFFGVVNFGIFYALILIPLGVVGVTTVYNFLAGFNGLEAGLGVLILSFLSYVSFVTGSAWLAVVGIGMVVCLIAFLVFNWTPAKVFGGDVLTYSIGALIASMAIVGNFEKIAFVVFIPFIVEMFLKLRGGLKKYSFGKANKDNSLSLRYDKIYGLTHFSIWFLSKFKKKVFERDVVLFIYFIELVFIGIGFLMLG